MAQGMNRSGLPRLRPVPSRIAMTEAPMLTPDPRAIATRPTRKPAGIGGLLKFSEFRNTTEPKRPRPPTIVINPPADCTMCMYIYICVCVHLYCGFLHTMLYSYAMNCKMLSVEQVKHVLTYYFLDMLDTDSTRVPQHIQRDCVFLNKSRGEICSDMYSNPKLVHHRKDSRGA